MSATLSIDTQHIARDLGLRGAQVDATLALLDAGNTVPFITRYRKDHTGGLDEVDIRRIQLQTTSLRLLLERKQTILRSIDSQGKLTPELAADIEAAHTTKRLDDLYLPFKPKKQTLATAARERGLELLAEEILAGGRSGAELDLRAADFANPDKGVPTAADALLGAGHIVAEQYSEHADLRSRLRKILRKSGKLVSRKIETAEDKRNAERANSPREEAAEPRDAEHDSPATDLSVVSAVAAIETPPVDAAPVVEPHTDHEAAEHSAYAEADESAGEADEATDIVADTGDGEAVAEASSEAATSSSNDAAEGAVAAATPAEAAAVPRVAAAVQKNTAKSRRDLRKEQKQKKDEKRERLLKALSDYFDFQEELKKLPPHRVLAINRGERAKALRVKIEADLPGMEKTADELLIPADHPNADFLRGCMRDALARLIYPSLEREMRRELTDNAEEHAVEVFARNLRHLLLQPPVHAHRVLAIDPGFRSGCKLAALDEFGGLLDHGIVHVIGKDKAAGHAQAKAKLAEMVSQHNLNVVAIGNGTACRETERLVADLITDVKAAGGELAYVIVNEAGASVYSTSALGREEFPQYDATLRGAISIGRRLLDPLSELVKIEPANIGVGLYQHDVKAKHLRESLDAVVESCVNYVGVDLNTASPALLRYVSGLNQLTAQRLYEHRTQNGPFRERKQLMEVPGFGEATFVQAAGFLKITGGENPLDGTWIHPESYDTAQAVLEKVGSAVGELANKEATAAIAQKTSSVNIEQTSGELGVGTHLLRDILTQLVRPGRDPREELPKPIFKHGVLKMEDLTPGMELSGTVLNVVDFGAFVDIGLHDSGLVHVSQMADRFIRDPHEVVAVGDVVKVWVATIDKDRRRVGLTMLAPGSERQPHPPRGKPPRRENQNRSNANGGNNQNQQGQAAQGEGAPADAAAQGQTRQGNQQGGQGRGGQRFGNQQGQRGGGRGNQQGSRGRPQGQRPFHQPQQHQPRPKPKPLVPLTKEMEEGKAPLRTFGDLLQFYQKKNDDEPEKT